jgi:hypothetical protein
MKQYPRIHSLSTIGLRHHQHFDYNFHPFRTDFVGDSGCGKSMIADLLQLIFVGSEAFKSPTQSTDKRLPGGMVLPISQNRRAGSGYAFLNVALVENKYIAIGIYLEQTNDSVQHYVIQAGYSDTELFPFNQPLTAADFLAGEQVLSRDDFSALASDKGLVCKYLPRRKFHQWLAKHHILPLDLSVSDKILRDYASIIQSFSRGPLLDIGKSHSLKEFLFGNEMAGEMLSKFRHAVREMQESTAQYGRNQKEIEAITTKQKDIYQLAGLKSELEKARDNWLFTACAFHQQSENELLITVEEVVRSTKDGLLYLDVYRSRVTERLSTSDSELETLVAEYKSALRALEAVQGGHSMLTKAKGLIDKLACKPNELEAIYNRNRELLKNQSILAALNQILNEQHILAVFDDLSKDNGSMAALLEALRQAIGNKKALIEKQTALLRFADINQEGTLGHWVITQQRPLSREQESVLMHFKSVPTRRPAGPKEGSKATADPGLLMQSPVTVKEENGFWLALGGLEEFISYIPEQIFSEDNIDNLRQALQQLAKGAADALKILETEVASLESLQQCLTNMANANEALTIYKSKHIWSNDELVPELNISIEEFGRYQSALLDADNIEQSYTQAAGQLNETAANKASFEAQVKILQAIAVELERLLTSNKWTEPLDYIAKAVLKNRYYNDKAALLQQLLQQERRANDLPGFYRSKIDEAKAKIKTWDIDQQWKQCQEAARRKDESQLAYQTAYGREPVINLADLGYITNPEHLHQAYQLAENAFNFRFDDMVNRHCADEAYRFTSVRNYEELCSAILPDILGKQKPEDLSEIEAIERYLQQINEKNKELNRRKLQKIRDVLDEVYGEVDRRRNSVRMIGQFLNHKDREITGGHRARLAAEDSRLYPLAWITEYSNKMQTDNTLFAIEGKSLADITIESISLEEKLLDAFRKLSGSGAAPDPKIEKLLDPNAYFDLSFSMVSSATGQINKGSTGQTYTAIALLCIARLSLVEETTATKIAPGLRFMPIDEAEGLGTNYDLLHKIAMDYDYQIISMSINPLSNFRKGEQYLYALRKNVESEEDINYTPWALFDGITT